MISLNWVKDYIDIEDEDLSELAVKVTKAGVNVKDTYIMVPQTIAANDLTFTINYTINGEAFTAQAGSVTTAQTWGTDTHTTYTIIVAPNVINFDVNSVAGWTTKPEGSATIN